jgi:hypothetical protein
MTKKNGLHLEQVRSLVQLGNLSTTPHPFNGLIDTDLLNLGITHGVASWCYLQTQKGLVNNLPSSELALWKTSYLQTALKYQQKFKTLLDIQNLFEQAGIPLIALKGIALASHLYKDEATRPMGDIDLLVPENRGMEALTILFEAGAKQTFVPRSLLHEQVHSHVRAVTLNGILIEIHQRLFSLGTPYHIDTAICLKNSRLVQKQGSTLRILNDTLMGYHLLGHIATNIKNGGLRLGWLLDVAMLFKQQPNLEVFVQDIIDINPSKQNQIRDLVKLSTLWFGEQGAMDYEATLLTVFELMKSRNLKQIHRIVNLKTMAQTPGIARKIHLFYRELFPMPEYMYDWGKGKEKRLWRLYIKRLFRF